MWLVLKAYDGFREVEIILGKGVRLGTVDLECAAAHIVHVVAHTPASSSVASPIM